MTDDMIRTYMAAAAMLMEDLSARLVLDPLAPERVQEMRGLADELVTIARAVEVLRAYRED